MFRQFYASLAALTAAVLDLNKRTDIMTTALDNLTAAVNAQATVDASAVTLIDGIVAELKATSEDPAIQALADQLTAATAPLAAAVAANTPAPAPTAPVAPSV